jgi:large subunit ribosomal protein L31
VNLKKVGTIMKKDIHPKYDETTITCACGNVMKVRSTGNDANINTCSKCHPFYTGHATLVDTEGRVEQFRKKYGLA